VVREREVSGEEDCVEGEVKKNKKTKKMKKQQ
jgi:hypothetical protein